MFPPITGRRLAAFAGLAVVASLLAPAASPAQTPPAPAAPQVTKKVTVPGQVVFRNAQRPGDPGNCSAITFVQWADVPNTVRATAFYTFRTSERSESRAAPFDDHYEWVATYQVEAGQHWIQIGKSWADGPHPNDCSEAVVRTRAFYPTLVARVDLFIDNTAKCTAARASLVKALANLKKAQARLKKAKSAKGKKRERTSVKKNQAKVKKAQTTQTTECTSS